VAAKEAEMKKRLRELEERVRQQRLLDRRSSSNPQAGRGSGRTPIGSRQPSARVLVATESGGGEAPGIPRDKSTDSADSRTILVHAVRSISEESDSKTASQSSKPATEKRAKAGLSPSAAQALMRVLPEILSYLSPSPVMEELGVQVETSTAEPVRLEPEIDWKGTQTDLCQEGVDCCTQTGGLEEEDEEGIGKMRSISRRTSEGGGIYTASASRSESGDEGGYEAMPRPLHGGYSNIAGNEEEEGHVATRSLLPIIRPRWSDLK